MKAQRRLNHAADQLPQAMLLLSELREGIIAGLPDSSLLGLLEQLGTCLSGLEDLTGARTPATLFDADG